MLARRLLWATRAGAGEGWTFVAGWGDGLVPLGADMMDCITESETNIKVSGAGACEVLGPLGCSEVRVEAAGIIREVRAAGMLQVAARAWLAQRHVAAEVTRQTAEWEEP